MILSYFDVKSSFFWASFATDAGTLVELNPNWVVEFTNPDDETAEKVGMAIDLKVQR